MEDVGSIYIQRELRMAMPGRSVSWQNFLLQKQKATNEFSISCCNRCRHLQKSSRLSGSVICSPRAGGESEEYHQSKEQIAGWKVKKKKKERSSEKEKRKVVSKPSVAFRSRNRLFLDERRNLLPRPPRQLGKVRHGIGEIERDFLAGVVDTDIVSPCSLLRRLVSP